MKHVVSFSGGRTSAYLVHLMEQRRALEGLDVEYVFMDTGAEHPETYKFVRNIVQHWGIKLTCLRAVVHPKRGVGITYKHVNIDDLSPDLQPWRDVLEKYGTPYNPGGAFCTRAMKLDPFYKYCDESFGKGNYTTWLGIRCDEPKRLNPKQGVEYLATISDFDKQDILEWWSVQNFDLQIPEWLGNCVFCIKKGVNKVALAAKDEPGMASEFCKMLSDPSVHINEKRKSPSLEMYRGKQSLVQIMDVWDATPREEILASLKGAKRFESGSCSESCEIFNEDTVELPDATGLTTVPWLTLYHNGSTQPIGQSFQADPWCLGEPDQVAGGLRIWNVDDDLRIVASVTPLQLTEPPALRYADEMVSIEDLDDAI